ncbi:protein phosphatase 2C domain-containing protein [Methylomarinum sp. Ch1-1]|uniref:Protein phosphatase 2C domain-containing protein n=1 Tax=Methylomarinum roseum TaxID=3067653 RepID=A0AAU7NYL2_9GAMM|nr:protein phosphatase 2C domain-containing protein [Methylomarinum sp. Ch1-1]MDP4521798.1 protein phosphatase 2C domain-containing protein [Methylomarinum sp. Ch1-1]
MPWKFGQALNIGKRSQQQDRVGIFHNGDKHLMVVADGMGGIPKGDLAAQIVVDTAEQAFNNNKTDIPESLLEDICVQAHEKINQLETDGGSAPGTTCALLYLDKRHAHWAHIGDSRLYHYRQNRLINRTLDHSLRQLMIEQGVLERTSEEADAVQNQLYKRLGGCKDPQPDIHASMLENGDLFLLCSDGFWQSIETQRIPAILDNHPLEDDGPERLVGIALENGGQHCDNISVALAQWQKTPPRFLPGISTFFTGKR